MNILGEAQKNETCPPNIREALDHAMVSDMILPCDVLCVELLLLHTVGVVCYCGDRDLLSMVNLNVKVMGDRPNSLISVLHCHSELLIQ